VPRCFASPFLVNLIAPGNRRANTPASPIKPYNMAGTTNSSLPLRTVVVIAFKNRLHGSG
jgi:hypothetical protein